MNQSRTNNGSMVGNFSVAGNSIGNSTARISLRTDGLCRDRWQCRVELVTRVT